MITILTTLVVSFTETTQKHLQVTQYSKNRLQAYWAAQSGLQAATALLKMGAQASALQGQSTSADGATSPWNCESEAYQQIVPLLLANVFCESSMLEPALLLTDPNESGTEMTLSRCPSAVPILDENRKLSIHKLIKGMIGTASGGDGGGPFSSCPIPAPVPAQGDGLRHGRGGSGNRDRLRPWMRKRRSMIDQAWNLAGYLVDWIDTENNKSIQYNPDTAEQSCPEDGLPYEAKNGLLDSIDEIGLVCGFRQLPRTTIERLTRHLTAYDLETNVNTATHPVLHAFCASPPYGNGVNEIESEEFFDVLHYDADQESIQIIEGDGDYSTLLGGVDSDLAGYLKDHTGFASDVFRVGVYGVVYNTENATVLARARLQMDLKKRGTTGEFDVLYYRED